MLWGPLLHTGTQQTQGLAASPSLCTHTDSSCLSITLPGSSHRKCVLQAPPGSFSEPLPEALCSCRNRAMVPGKMTTQTFPNSPNTDGTLLNNFSCTQDSCLPYPTPSREQLRHIQQTSSPKLFWWVNKSQRARHN